MQRHHLRRTPLGNKGRPRRKRFLQETSVLGHSVQNSLWRELSLIYNHLRRHKREKWILLVGVSRCIFGTGGTFASSVLDGSTGTILLCHTVCSIDSCLELVGHSLLACCWLLGWGIPTVQPVKMPLDQECCRVSSGEHILRTYAQVNALLVRMCGERTWSSAVHNLWDSSESGDIAIGYWFQRWIITWKFHQLCNKSEKKKKKKKTYWKYWLLWELRGRWCFRGTNPVAFCARSEWVCCRK